jgi:hypothetical protein
MAVKLLIGLALLNLAFLTFEISLNVIGVGLH